MVSRADDNLYPSNTAEKKWLIIFAISLSANVLFVTFASIEEPLLAAETSAHVLKVSLKVSLMPPLSVLGKSIGGAVDTPVLATPARWSPANRVAQADGESLQIPPENTLGDMVSNLPPLVTSKTNKPQKSRVAVNETQSDQVLLDGGDGADHQLKRQLKRDAHEALPAPETAPVHQPEFSENPSAVQIASLAQGAVSDPTTNANTGLTNPAGTENIEPYTQAQYLRRHPPRYPERARTLGQQGTVVLHAEVLPSGYSQHLKVAVSSGHRLLDGAAIAAVKKWQFVPAYAQGHPVAHWVSVPVRFALQ